MKNSLKKLPCPGGFLSVLLIITILTSCSDEINYKTETPETFGEGLSISIPNINGTAQFVASRAATRAAADSVYAEAEEGEFKNLWLLAFKHESDGDFTALDPFNLSNYTDDTDDKVKVKTSNEYSVYTISNQVLPEGEYKFYLLANLDDYLADDYKIEDKKLTSPDAVENLVLNFANYTAVDANPLTPGNLPMACLSSDFRTGVSPDSKVGDELFTLTKDGNTLYADLTFQCVKVRYTILFDSDDFSSAYGDFLPEFSVPTVSKVRNSTALNYTADNDFQYSGSYIQRSNSHKDIWNASLSPVTYPSGTYPALDSENKSVSKDLEKIESHANTDKQRAWQGVLYLPQNPQTVNVSTSANLVKLGSQELYDVDASIFESADVKVSYLTFESTSSSGDKTLDPKTFICTLMPGQFTPSSSTREEGTINGTYKANGTLKGHFYDLTFNLSRFDAPLLPVSVTVNDWGLKELQYDIHGSYFLELETTQIGIETGEEKTLWFRTDIDPEDLRFDSCPITFTDSKTGKEVTAEFYSARVLKEDANTYALHENGTHLISVKINPAIPSSVLLDINEQGYTYNGKTIRKEDVNYFHVIAGNLKKKVKVDPLTLKSYLKVTPQTILIDVREFITSGTDSGDIDIEFETNVTDKNIELSYTSADGTDIFSGNLPITITEEGTTQASTGSLSVSQGKLVIHLLQLFDGLSYWRQEHTYTLTFSVEGCESQTVTITVKPYSTDYTIHLFAPGWITPHIYVYQCLELPQGLTGTNANYAGTTVGYEDSGNTLAALEYAFTADVAFRGWKGYGGPDANDPNASGWGYDNKGDDNNSLGWTKGFFIFNDGSDRGSQGQTYKPLTSNSQFESRYQTGQNFNKAHIDNIGSNWYCDACKDEGWDIDHRTNALWPGIVMEKEDGGWWKYTLSGVATPGKAMIMFNNHHTDDIGNGNRYPENNAVGVPLFDYPDNEGWFVFDGSLTNGSHTNKNQNFMDDKPDVESSVHVATICWPTYKGDLIHLWNSTTGTDFTDWNNGPNKGKLLEGTSYYYYEFIHEVSGALSVTFRGTGDEIKEEYINFIPMSEFDEDHNYFVFIDDAIGYHKGNPNNLKRFQGGENVTIIFDIDKTKATHAHIYETDDPLSEWPGEYLQTEKFVNFKIKDTWAGFPSFKYILSRNGADQEAEKMIFFDDLSPVSGSPNSYIIYK